MKVKYELTPDDWAAFGEYHARNSRSFQRAVRTGTVVGVLFFIAIGGILSLSEHSPTMLVAGLVAAIFWGWYWPRKTIANVRAQMSTRDRQCVRGRHFMEALPEGLHAKCDVTDSMIVWAGIHNVIRTADHVFVMLSDVQGYVIPKKRVIAGELEPLVGEIERLRTRPVA